MVFYLFLNENDAIFGFELIIWYDIKIYYEDISIFMLCKKKKYTYIVINN